MVTLTTSQEDLVHENYKDEEYKQCEAEYIYEDEMRGIPNGI